MKSRVASRESRVTCRNHGGGCGSRSEVENPALVGNLERVRVRKIRITLWLIEIAVVITHPTSLRRPERADR